MRNGETIERNLKLKQEAFFLACDAAGLTMGVMAARSGLPIGTLRSYRTVPSREPSIMGFASFVAIVGSLPAEHVHLASVLIEDTGCTITRLDPNSAEWLALGEKLCRAGAKIMRYQQSDGHIDHAEDADLRTDMIEIVSDGAGKIGGRA
jgi:hypothetical protein